MLSPPLDRYARTRDAEAFAEIVHEYQSLVLATCRRKLANPADVDDAAQETFLRLARKASHLHSNLGAWLHRCAVNVSIDINRRRRARTAHESAAASSGVRDDPQRELAELREHLDDALAKLPAADRELIIERFFVGTPQIDIAARAGVTPSTITHRLQKAIESLRRHLGTMGFAAATAGAAALAEILHSEHASAAVEKGLTANLMKIGLSGVAGSATVPVAAILIAAALLLLLGLASWFAWDQISVPGSPVAQLLSQASVPTSAPSAFTVNANQAANAIPPDWQQPQPAAQSGVLSGRVTDAAGKPVRGALVEIMDSGTTTTDAQGYYNFRALRRGRSGTYQLSVRAAGFVDLGLSNNTPTIQLNPASRARRDFVLQKGQQIIVLATDTQGKRLNAVDVDVCPLGQHFGGGRIRPDPTGRGEPMSYTIPLNQGSFEVFACMENFAPLHQVVAPVSPGKPINVTFVLQPGLTVKGTAMCSDHKPAAGYSVSAEPDWWTGGETLSQAQVDARGNFSLTGLAPGANVLYVWGDGNGRQIGTIQMPPTTQPIVLNVPLPSLASEVTATGRIRLSGGRLSQDMLSVDFTSLGNRERYSAWAQPVQHSRTELQYSLKMPAGVYSLSIDSEDITPFQIDRVELPGDLPLITLQVTGQPHLTGTVTDPTGNPVHNFAVRVRKFETIGNGPNYSQDAQWTQVNDPGGKFSVECVGPGIYSLQISTRDYAWQWTPKVRLEENQRVKDIPIRLTPGGSIAGIVTDSSANPVAGAKVIPLSMAVSTDLAMQDQDNFEGESGAVVSDAGGHFILPHLQPGTETLKVVDPDFSPLIVPALAIAEGKTTDAGSISLHLGGTVEGTVYDVKCQPFPHASLLFQDSEDQVIFMDARVKAHQVLAVTADENGRYRARHLPTEYLWVNLANGRDVQGVTRRVVRPLDGKTAELNFGGPSPTIGGRLMKDGKPYPYQNLLLTTQSFMNSPVEARGASDADGNFAFFGAPPGRYVLSCMFGAGRDWVPIGRFELADQPLDLGTIDCDQGDVVLRFAFDDPALASSRRSVCVSSPFPNGLLWARMLDFGDEGDHLRATGVPAQSLIISAAFFDDGNLLFTAPFQRIAGTAEMSVTMRIPKSSATLRLIDTSAPSGKETFPVRFDLQSEDGSTHCEIGLWDSSTDNSRLPPGRYYFSYPMGSTIPIPGLPHFVLTAGQTTEIRTDFSPARFRHVNVAVWSSTGIPITSPSPQVFDPSGNQLPPCDVPRIGTLFFLRPGNYRVVQPLARGSSFSQQITVPPLSPGQGPWTEVPVDVVLPE
jgi:RNA polymerase sigma factor (sigma-70 family)